MTLPAVAWGLLILALTASRWSAVGPFAAEIAAGFGSVRVPVALTAAGSHILGLFVIAAGWLGCRGAGSPTVRWLSPRACSGSGRIGLIAGWATIATAGYGLALAGLFFPGMLGSLLILSLIVRIRAARRRTGSAPLPSPVSPGWLLTAGLPGLVALPFLLAPMPCIDTYQYHLAAPERFVRVHREPGGGRAPACALGGRVRAGESLVPCRGGPHAPGAATVGRGRGRSTGCCSTAGRTTARRRPSAGRILRTS